jgi:hypothetical protein
MIESEQAFNFAEHAAQAESITLLLCMRWPNRKKMRPASARRLPDLFRDL